MPLEIAKEGDEKDTISRKRDMIEPFVVHAITFSCLKNEINVICIKCRDEKLVWLL